MITVDVIDESVLTGLFCEDYDDQTVDWKYIVYKPLRGPRKVLKADDDVTDQVQTIRQQFGENTPIQLYK